MIRVLLMVVVARVKVGQSLEVQTRTKLATIASSRVTSRKIVGSGKRSIPMMRRGLRRALVVPRLAMRMIAMMVVFWLPHMSIRVRMNGFLIPGSFHMTPNKELFATYEKVDEGNVTMGNNATSKIVGVRSIQIKMFDGMVRTLSDVRHVPGLKKNLISLSTLDK